jgi:hypothetical protein
MDLAVAYFHGMRPLLTVALALLSLAFVGCDKKSSYAGRWVATETVVENTVFSGNQATNVVRSLNLDENGNGSFVIANNGKVIRQDVGKWSVVSDVFLLDYEGGKTVYFRVLRLTNERLVIRTEEGFERIYDRIK